MRNPNNIANLEPLDPVYFDEAKFRAAIDEDDIEAEEQTKAEYFEPTNKTRANLNMALDQLGGVRIVYEADFKQEYPSVVAHHRAIEPRK